MCPNTDYITHLTSLSIIEISGDDASSFLQAQMTGDINKLKDGESQFSAWCNAAGKVIATFIVSRNIDRYYLILPVDILDTVYRRLKMYVFRAKVNLSYMTNSHTCLGACMQNPETVQNEFINKVFSSIKIPVPNDPTRVIFISANNEMPALFAGIAAHGTRIIPDESWQITDMTTGIPWICHATSEQFLPQELNLEPLGGLSYNKGCYPGQEIIARLHFRGRQKRQLCTGYIQTSGPLPAPGINLPSQTESQTAGAILNCVRESDSLVRVLAVIDTEKTGTDTVTLGNGDLLHLTLVSDQSDS